ncbi:Uncharacterised protein [Mycobacteroides abscessus subsp. abscessus]|nr:Uncharacterised protein [Mycobacteroides abscessus subsp. abscessus]
MYLGYRKVLLVSRLCCCKLLGRRLGNSNNYRSQRQKKHENIDRKGNQTSFTNRFVIGATYKEEG